MHPSHIIHTFTPSISNSVARGLFGFALTAVLAMTAATAQVVSGTTGIDNSGNAQSEMTACNTGRTQQDKETCLIEVKNATEARRAVELDKSGGQFNANALARCKALSGEDKLACEGRVAGYGNPQGSVAGGGVMTEIETVIVPPTGDVSLQRPTQIDTILVVPATK